MVELEEDMKKNIVLSMIICMFLSGCGAGLSVPGLNTDLRSPDGIINCSTTYFDNYSSKIDDNICKVKGIIHQMASDRNGVLTDITALDDCGSITVTGSMDCIKGTIRLVYTMPDGTETLIADSFAGKIDMRIDIPEGEGTVNFVSEGKNAVCNFDLVMEAEGLVTFGATLEDVESTEELEDVESIENPENIESIETIEAEIKLDRNSLTKNLESMAEELEEIEKEDLTGFGIDEIEDNWPESIRYRGDGVYAAPLTVTIEIDKPVTLSLSCITVDGDLRLKVVDYQDETVYFDETNPEGTYTVAIQHAGIYQMLFYAKYHVGSVVVTPEEELH